MGLICGLTKAQTLELLRPGVLQIKNLTTLATRPYAGIRVNQLLLPLGGFFTFPQRLLLLEPLVEEQAFLRQLRTAYS